MPPDENIPDLNAEPMFIALHQIEEEVKQIKSPEIKPESSLS